MLRGNITGSQLHYKHVWFSFLLDKTTLQLGYISTNWMHVAKQRLAWQGKFGACLSNVPPLSKTSSDTLNALYFLILLANGNVEECFRLLP